MFIGDLTNDQTDGENRSLNSEDEKSRSSITLDFCATSSVQKNKREQSARSRAWCFTFNNYTDNDVTQFKELATEYIVFGYEVGESGTPHLQGYLYLKNAASLSAIKKRTSDRVHFEIAKGSPLSASNYCKKDGNFYEAGVLPSPGKRTDIDTVKELLSSSNSSKMRTICDSANSVQSIKFAETYLKYKEKGRTTKPTVTWYYGPTGVGKSKSAYESVDMDDCYTAMSTGKWFEGYDGHSHVIIDDMRRDFAKFHELLRLLDCYPIKVECKGGSRQFLATNIIITSCYSPSSLYETREDVGQLIRRIDNIIHIDKDGVKHYEKPLLETV